MKRYIFKDGRIIIERGIPRPKSDVPQCSVLILLNPPPKSTDTHAHKGDNRDDTDK